MSQDKNFEELIKNKKMKKLCFLAKGWSLDHPGRIYVVDNNNPETNSNWFKQKFGISILSLLDEDRFASIMKELTTYNRIKFKLAQQKEVAREQYEDPRFKELADQIDHLKQQNEKLTALVMLLSKKLELDVPTEKECHICHKNKE